MPDSPTPPKWRSALWLLLPATLILLERCYTYSEPLERDIATYAVIGNEMLKGRDLYSDLWDNKPPFLYLTYGLAEAVAGMGPGAILLLNLLFSFAILAGLYRCGRRYGGERGGFLAALLWAVCGGDPSLLANQPNGELFLNAFQTWFFALWISRDETREKTASWAGIGCLLAIASLYKPFAILEGLSLSAIFLFGTPGRPIPGRGRLLPLALVFAPVAAAWGATCGYFALRGHWADFKYALFTYNAFISNYNPAMPGAFLARVFRDIHFDFVAPVAILLGLGGLAGLVERKGESHFLWLYWAASLAACELETAATGYFAPHYYQLLLPSLVLGGSWGLVWAGDLLKRKGEVLSWVPAVTVLVVLVPFEMPFYLLPPQAWTEKKYLEGPLFVQSYRLGGEIDRLLKPNETFFEWGTDTQLYFVSRRPPPSGLFYSYPLRDGNPLAGELCRRVVRDLERTEPELAVINTLYLPDLGSKCPPLLAFLRAHYVFLPQDPFRGYFQLLCRKGGALEARLLNKDGMKPPMDADGRR